MDLSKKSLIKILCFALIIRIFSQLIWEAYLAINLSSHEFIFALIIAPLFWLQFEIPKALTCLLMAALFLLWIRWVRENLRLPSYAILILNFIVFFLFASLHAYVWLFVDCQFILNRTPKEGECSRFLFEPRHPSKWFPSY